MLIMEMEINPVINSLPRSQAICSKTFMIHVKSGFFVRIFGYIRQMKLESCGQGSSKCIAPYQLLVTVWVNCCLNKKNKRIKEILILLGHSEQDQLEDNKYLP